MLWRSRQALSNNGRDYNTFFQISEYTFGLRQKDLNKSQQTTFGFGFVCNLNCLEIITFLASFYHDLFAYSYQRSAVRAFPV